MHLAKTTAIPSGRAGGRAWPRGRRPGGAVLDMALVLPVLLYLAFGTVEYGYYFYVKHNVQSAAREGARAAIVPSATAGDVTTAVSVANSSVPAWIASPVSRSIHRMRTGSSRSPDRS